MASFKFSIKEPLSKTHSIADLDASLESSAITAREYIIYEEIVSALLTIFQYEYKPQESMVLCIDIISLLQALDKSIHVEFIRHDGRAGIHGRRIAPAWNGERVRSSSLNQLSASNNLSNDDAHRSY